MPNYQVTGRVTCDFDMNVEASTENEAEQIVNDMDYGRLVENARIETEVYDVRRVKKQRAR